MDLTERFFLIVEDAMAVHGLHFDSLSTLDRISSQEFRNRKPKVGSNTFLFFRREGDGAFALATKAAALTLEDRLTHFRKEWGLLPRPCGIL